MVCPTKSGKIVESRLQVRITLRSPLVFMRSIFFISLGLTYGPFFRLRGIFYPPVTRFAFYRFLLRRRMMYWSVRLLRRVFLPRVGLPQGVFGLAIPIGERPSPPPCGCEAGSIAVPRTDGRQPSQRLRPALPSLMLPCSVLPTCPTVARQSWRT